MTGAIDGCDDDIAKEDEADGGGNDEEGDLVQPLAQASAECFGDFCRGAEGAGHGGEFGGGDSHAEEADGQGVEGLGVSEGRDGRGTKKAAQPGVDVGADLHDSSAEENRDEV